jgi:uncharacterized membrane protein YsdA (DUF1294 family)
LYAGALFLILLVLAAATEKINMLVPAFYGGASLVTFVMYWSDKSAAKAGRSRTPEATLHLFSLAGGWPGALAAQYWLRHKSQKKAFLYPFWGTVAANCAILGWLAI